MRLRDTDARKPSFVAPEIDAAIAGAYLTLQSRLPPPDLYTASAFTISAGGDTFTLPATVTSWTGNDGGAEYAGAFRIQLASDGRFLIHATGEQLDSFRSGQQAVQLGKPRLFTLWEDKNQAVQGRCYPGANAAEVCNLFATLSADDLRDYVGAGTDDLDDVEVLFSRIAAQALELRVASDLLIRMTEEDAKLRRLSPDASKMWLAESEMLAWQEACRRNDLDDSGRIQRWVP